MDPRGLLLLFLLMPSPTCDASHKPPKGSSRLNGCNDGIPRVLICDQSGGRENDEVPVEVFNGLCGKCYLANAVSL